MYILQAEHGTNVCLILVSLQKDIKCILDELGYWFGFISYHSVNLEDTVKVLVGSHIDCITETEVDKKVDCMLKLTQKYLSHAPKANLKLHFIKCLTLNCCNPRSSKYVRDELLEAVKKATPCHLSTEASILLGLLIGERF